MSVNLDKIISELVKDISKPILAKMHEVGSTQYNKALVALEVAFKKYLKNSYRRYSKIKTLLYRDRPVSLREHYVSSDFNLGQEKVSGSYILESFVESKRNIVVGTAGSGKSVLLRRLFLDFVEKQAGIAPVLVELRLIESTDSEITIQHYIHRTISELDENLTSEQLHYALKQGKIILLLDGFDEIDFSNREKYEKEILAISRKYPETIIVVSSRPDECFSSWEEFHIYRALPLTKEQAADLISRIDYDTTVKKKFTEELVSGLYDRHEDFLSNPLLLTMMLLTYEQLAEIPEKIHIFYEQAFDTLFHKHDALKSLYKRKSYTGLPIDDFKRLFAAFCILTYSDRKISFSHQDLIIYIRQAVELESVSVDPQNFFNDLIKSVCIIQKDGNVYTFTHRSFQEYFSAYFISRSQSIDFEGVLDSLVKGYFRDSVIKMLFELNREQIEINWVIPKLRELVPMMCEAADANSDIAAFLGIFYEALSAHDNGIAIQLSERKTPGYFTSFLGQAYKEHVEQFFPTQNLSEEERKAKGKREVALLKKHCHLEEGQSIAISNLTGNLSWLDETHIPKYCKRKLRFFRFLLNELDCKYTTKGNSLKALLHKKTKSDA